MPDEFTPHVTPLGAQTLDALVVAAGYVQSAAYAPTTSASSLTITQPSVVVVVPTAATSGGGSALSLTIASQSVTVPASMDTYVDVTSAGTLVPSSVVVGTAAPPLANGGNATRLYCVTTNGSGVTTLFQIAPVNIPLTIDQIKADGADVSPTDPSGFGYTLRFSLATIRNLALAALADLTSYVPLSQKGQAGGVAALNAQQQVVGPNGAAMTGPVTVTVPAGAADGLHIIGTSTGGSPGSVAQPEVSLEDGATQKTSLSLAFAYRAFSALAAAGDSVLRALNSAGNIIVTNQNAGKAIIFGIGSDSAHDAEVMRLTAAGIVGGGGAAGGVAALNAQQQVVQPPATGVRQTVPLINTADVWLDSGHQNSREPGNQADYISLFTIPIRTSGGNIELRCSGLPWDNLGNGTWMALGVALDAGLVTQVDYSICSVAAGNAAFDHAVHAEHLWTGVAAGAHTVHVMGQSGGPAGATQSSGFLGLTHPNTSPFHAIVSEIA